MERENRSLRESQGGNELNSNVYLTIHAKSSRQCFNETTQSSDFRENGDKRISFLAIPRSHLPEIPDIRAQAILAKWKTDLTDALKRERLNRLTSSRTAKRSSEQTTRQASPSPRKEREPAPLRPAQHRNPPAPRNTRPPPAATTTKSTSSSSSAPPRSKLTSSLSKSTLSIISTESSSTTTVLTEPEVVEVDDPVPACASAPTSAPDHTWRNVAWTIGSRVLYEALAALGREHSVRTEERQLNMRLAAAAAEQNQQFWTNVASWGAWSAHTALQYYFGSAGSRGNNLIGNT